MFQLQTQKSGTTPTNNTPLQNQAVHHHGWHQDQTHWSTAPYLSSNQSIEVMTLITILTPLVPYVTHTLETIREPDFGVIAHLWLWVWHHFLKSTFAANSSWCLGFDVCRQTSPFSSVTKITFIYWIFPFSSIYFPTENILFKYSLNELYTLIFPK